VVETVEGRGERVGWGEKSRCLGFLGEVTYAVTSDLDLWILS
jgi:hypothetical protein